MLVFYGQVKDNAIIISRRDALRSEMHRLKRFELLIRKRRKLRSGQQNKYYWGCVLHYISEETGHLPDELHEAFKRKFLQSYNNRGLSFVKSTTELTTTEFMEYVEHIRRFAAQELGITIPDPEMWESDDGI